MPTMKACIYERYGPPEVLQFKDIERPMPKANEVLIKIHATTVTAGDWRVRSLNVPAGFKLMVRLAFGITKPRQPVLGSELSGVVVAVGKDVKKFKIGDPVFAFSDASMGCYAEYKCMPEEGAVALKPANLSDGEAAALSFGGTTALYFFRKANLKSGEKVLINGASGGVGTAAIQLAKYFGAEVTGVCSTANIEWVKLLGADHVIDYTQDDFTQSGETYDVIVDTAGTAPFVRSKAALKKDGRLLMVLAGLPDMLQLPWLRLTNSQKVIVGTASGQAEDLRFLAELAEAGAFKPVIDRTYPFEQMVEAHHYVDTGRKKGNVIITLKHED